MENFCKQVEDKKRCSEPKKNTVFRMKAIFSIESKELLVIWPQINIIKSVFYVHFIIKKWSSTVTTF